MKVSAASTPSINDTSNAVFSITGVPGVTIVSPNGGETWQAGTEHNITWTSGGAGNLKIEYSTDGGSNYSQIVASTPDDTSYAWLVPNTPSLSCLVRVSEEAGGSPDVSDATFTIIGGSVPLLNELVVDFGTIGLWRMAAAGATMMSGVNGDDFIAVNSDASADSEVAADFGTIGLWLWNSGAWSQLSGVNAESMAAVNIDGGRDRRDGRGFRHGGTLAVGVRRLDHAERRQRGVHDRGGYRRRRLRRDRNDFRRRGILAVECGGSGLKRVNTMRIR